jgi:hypothetical protein
MCESFGTGWWVAQRRTTVEANHLGRYRRLVDEDEALCLHSMLRRCRRSTPNLICEPTGIPRGRSDSHQAENALAGHHSLFGR